VDEMDEHLNELNKLMEVKEDGQDMRQENEDEQSSGFTTDEEVVDYYAQFDDD